MNQPKFKKVTCLGFILGFGLKESNLFAPLSEMFVEMAKLGHSFHIISRTNNCSDEDFDLKFPSGGSLRVYKIDQKRRFGKTRHLSDILSLVPKIIKEHQPNVIYTHILPYYADIAITLAKVYRIPHVYWICSHWPKEIHNQTFFLKRWVGDFNHSMIMNKTDQVFTCTDFCLNEDSQRLNLPKEKFSILPNSVNFDRFEKPTFTQEDLKQKYQIPQDAKLILYFSSLSIRKGAIDLLEAVPILRSITQEKFFVLFCGPGKDLQEKYEQIAVDSNVQDIVLFTGNISSGEAPNYYNACDIFCVPARYEGFGRVYIEAMACKKPVLTCKIGGIPEVVVDNENGILVPSKSPKDIAKGLMVLLEDPTKAKRYGESGFQRAKQFYCHKIVAQNTINEFLIVINSYNK